MTLKQDLQQKAGKKKKGRGPVTTVRILLKTSNGHQATYKAFNKNYCLARLSEQKSDHLSFHLSQFCGKGKWVTCLHI